MVLTQQGDIIDHLVAILDRELRRKRIGSDVNAQIEQAEVGEFVQAGKVNAGAEKNLRVPAIRQTGFVHYLWRKAVRERVGEQTALNRCDGEKRRQVRGIVDGGEVVHDETAAMLRLLALRIVDVQHEVFLVGK